MKSRVLSILVIVGFLCCGITQAQIPRKLNYQGYLSTPTGAPANTPQTLIVRIYDAASGGNLLFTETHSSVTMTNGIFNILLGSVDELDLKFNAQYYLGITVGTDPEMSPRQPLAASPYAIRAATADSAEALRIGGTIGEVLAGTGAAPAWTGSPTFGGNVTVSGSLGIPTASTSGILPTKLNVVANSPKAIVATTRALAVTSNDAAAPFALDVKVVGAPALVDRAIILQTTDWNSADGGNLLLQPQGGNVGVGTSTTGSKLTVAGRIESTSGGVKFPDGSVQTTAAGGAVPGTFQWQVVAGTTQQAQSNTGYVANNAAQVSVTLPTAPNVGDTVRVSGAGGGGWRIAQNASQSVSGSYFGLTFVDSWSPRDSLREWSSVAASADGSKLVAAVSGPGGLLYTSTDYGASWTPRESVRNWQSVASSSDGSKLVGAAYLGQLYTSIDSGITWTQRDSVRQWKAVASSSDGSKLVAAEGGNGFIYTSIDFGQTWTQRAASGGRLWQSVASSSDGSKLVAVAYNDNLYTSSDSGVTWTPRDSVRYWTAVASSADGSKLVAAAHGAGGQLFTSTNSGATWTPRETSRTWTSLASSVDGNRLVAVAGSAQIYTSSDFGVGWTARETSRQWAAVASSADGIRLVAAATGVGPGGGGLIYTSVPAVNTFAASTTVGVTGYLTGLQRSAIELQYIGGGQFMPLSYVGTIGSY